MRRHCAGVCRLESRACQSRILPQIELHLLCAGSGVRSAVLPSPRRPGHPTASIRPAGAGLKEREERSRNANTQAATDRLLVRRFNGGDASAFDEIVKRYRGRIQLLAARFLRSQADAEEIAQDTFIRAYQGLARFRGESSLATWLHRITVNLAPSQAPHAFPRLPPQLGGEWHLCGSRRQR